MSTETSPELHSHYYLHNFLKLCQTVEEQYFDILAPDERNFLQQFQSLDQSAQCLYVRLISRVGPWFRESKLSYPEITGLEKAVAALLETGAAMAALGLTVEELGVLFTSTELQLVYRDLLPGPKITGKARLLQAVDELCLAEDVHLSLLTGTREEQVITPVGVGHVQLLQILFFGNRHQGLTDFVLSDLGLARYYPYKLNPEHRLFTCREALDEYLDCCEFEDIFYQLLELDDEEGLLELADHMVHRQIKFPVGLRRWQRAWNTVAREMERRQQFDLAWQLYERSDRHPSRERRARILEAQQDWTGVVTLCETMVSAPWCEAEREAANTILGRARRKLGGPMIRRSADQFREQKLKLVPHSDCVERDAAASLHDRWHSVHFVENGLMNTLFGLAFWEQIFADVPGAFHNPYQGAPRDMYDGEFVENRKVAIQRWLQELRRASLPEVLMSNYRRYQGYQCHWVDWALVDESLLQTALQMIPADHLFAIWQRQLFDPAQNSSGFPDLIAFADPAISQPDNDNPDSYCLIEVKGPGDSLQNNQKRWLRYFSQHSIPAAVAWVEWERA